MENTIFRLDALKTDGPVGALFRLFGPLGDRILGLDKFNRRFRKHNLAGLDKDRFLHRVLELLKVHTIYDTSELRNIPKEGPVVIVANHPYGGLEGIILAALLTKVRPDVKVLANLMLRLIVELRDLFIFTNPLVKNHPGNIKSLRLCREWLQQGHALVLFPAGRVSFYRKDLKTITDGEWNRIATSMTRLSRAPVVPVHIAGSNSALFQILGRIYYRFRLLLLPRELLKSGGRSVAVRVGRAIPFKELERFNTRAMTRYIRMRTYLLASPGQAPVIRTDKSEQALIAAVPTDRLLEEIEALPAEQHLHDFKDFSVYYGYYEQLTETVREIGRLRELTFRELDEGSGSSCDTDAFDKTYTQLFIWDRNKREIIGGYRMGQMDRLCNGSDLSPLYLSQLFNFSESFLQMVAPGLEMGRSWIRKEHQRSFHGLYLLWRGIGEFMLRHPRYHTFYGTVSLSTTYHPYSLALMSKVLIGDDRQVEPIHPFKAEIPEEVNRYLQRTRLSVKGLSRLVRALEPDGTDLPILVKQYLKLGARFHSIAIDKGFNNTPGALLSVDLRRTPRHLLEMYLGEAYPRYLQYHGITLDP